MTDVILHVYDVTNSESEKVNNDIMKINKFFKDGIGLGGIFHCAVQVYGDIEWAFGACEDGTGIYSCPSGKNPVYRYREGIVLGKTNVPLPKFVQIMEELARDWPGSSYDLFSNNCNHFCNVLCVKLDVMKLPGWVNRFAKVCVAIENTASRMKQAKMQMVSASKVASRFIFNFACNKTAAGPNTLQNNSNRGSPRFPVPWFKFPSTSGAKQPDAAIP